MLSSTSLGRPSSLLVIAFDDMIDGDRFDTALAKCRWCSVDDDHQGHVESGEVEWTSCARLLTHG